MKLKMLLSSQTITLDLYLIQTWHDPRLQVANMVSETVLTEAAQINQYWMPDTYLINGASVSVINALQPIEKLTIDQQGNVTLMMRVNAQLSCYMNLQNYPMDIQYCRVKISSRKFNFVKGLSL